MELGRSACFFDAAAGGAIEQSVVDGRLLVFPTGLFVAGMAASFLLGNLRDELQTRLGLAVVIGCALIGLAAVIAAIGPALRGARLDPKAALRAE